MEWIFNDKMAKVKVNYHNKVFRALSNSENGLVDEEMSFHYQQEGNVLSCTYKGVNILKGQLLGLVNEAGVIDMRYHQIDKEGQLQTGYCRSTPLILEDGRIRLYEKWRWTSGDLSEGNSILEEILE